MDRVSIPAAPQNKKIMTIDREHLQIILSWIKGENVFNNKPNKWDWLLITTSLAKSDDIELDEHEFEEILEEAIILTDKIKNAPILDNLDNPILKSLNIDNDLIKKEIERMNSFSDIVEDLLLTNDFDKENLNKIKLSILKDLLKKNIQSENYERCITLSSDIKKLETYFSKA